MKHPFRHRSLLALAAALVAGSALSAPATFYDEDLGANGVFLPNGDAAKARADFLATLVGDVGQSDNVQGAVLTNGTALLPGIGQTPTATTKLEVALGASGAFTSQTGAGRFNTSPTADAPCAFDEPPTCKFWETAGNFTITFAEATRAFGFYGTDFSDFSGTLDLYLIGNGNDVKVTVPTGSPENSATIGGGSTNAEDSVNGSLIFFGVTHAERYFTAVRFEITQTGTSTDAFGFDDFVIGKLDAPEPPPPQPVPEPATLALVGLAIAGLAASRRKRA